MAIINTSKIITIDRFFNEEEALYPHATGEFTAIMRELMLAIRILAMEVRRAGINDILGLTETHNATGDKVRKLDKYANEVIYKSMVKSNRLCLMASEENEHIIKIPKKYNKGKYVLIYDPIDGSSNIDVGITIGSTFGIYKKLDSDLSIKPTIEDVLQPGKNLVAAGYVLYGSSTIFVYTSGNGVNVFTYDPTIGEFILTFEKIKIPKRGKHFSCNLSHYNEWDENIRQYFHYLVSPHNSANAPYKLRYIATAVADIHRTLHNGGIYMYPAFNGNEAKIRLVYEANPLAMIIEQAGGKAINGEQRLLELKPKSIHQQVPFFVGSTDTVQEAEKFIKGVHPFQIKQK